MAESVLQSSTYHDASDDDDDDHDDADSLSARCLAALRFPDDFAEFQASLPITNRSAYCIHMVTRRQRIMKILPI